MEHFIRAPAGKPDELVNLICKPEWKEFVCLLEDECQRWSYMPHLSLCISLTLFAGRTVSLFPLWVGSKALGGAVIATDCQRQLKYDRETECFSPVIHQDNAY